MKKLIVIITLLFCGFSMNSLAQKYSEGMLRDVLDNLAGDHPGLDNKLQLNVSGLQLSELVTSVALENNLNVSVDPNLNQLISYNFYDAQVKDMLVFLYLNFEIEYEFVGSIISIQIRDKEEVKPVVAPPKKLEISYNPANKFLSMDLKNDTLWKVVDELTRVSEFSFVVDPAVRNQPVNAYFLNRPHEQVLEMFVKSNELILEKNDDYYTIGKGVKDQPIIGPNARPSNYSSNAKNGDFVLIKNDVGTLDVFARDVDLQGLIQAAAEETGVRYVLYSDVKGKVNLDLTDVRFDELADMVLNGTNYSIKKEGEIYMIGENKVEGLRKTELIRLNNRTIESVKAAIPNDMLTNLEVKEFVELNGLILTGSARKIDELKTFISSIDVVVPMVQIDVMLVYSERGSGVKTGIKAGVKDTPTSTSGEVFPGLDVELGSQSINNILSAITGFGLVNLGQVTENFYVSLQALESNNVIDIESTPKISTLNGHEASISIGETTYYQETQVNVQTSVTNQGVLQSRQWKPIDANLSVTIKPFVSADEHVTLTITVEQDDFSGKIDPSSPPNITTQTFESMVRVKNGELILLGGLEKKQKTDSGSGVPFLSRIPVLKWFFSSREKTKSKSKLHILIRPIVTY
jgi:type IV pilus assembly protein PilQ